MTRVNQPQGRWQRHVVFFPTALLLVAADQTSKLWIRANMLPGQSVPEEGILRLTYVTNTGGVFGFFVNQTVPLIFSSIAAIIAILFLYRYLPNGYLFTRIGLGLLLGGSAGNLIDRIWLGRVTDFIDVKLWQDFHWPPFNLADAAIVIGVIIITCTLLFLCRRKGCHA